MSSETIEARDLFNETVIDALPVGVIVLDRQGYVVKYNRFEEQLARRLRRDVIGRHFFEDVAVCTDVPEVRGRFDEHIDSNTLAAELDFSFDLPFQPQPRDVRLRLRSFDVEGHFFGVIVVEDLTLPKELERQRQRLLDIMVHDLRNPLQGILGYASLLEVAGDSQSLSGEDLAQAAETIKVSATRMDQLLRSALAEMRGERRDWTPVNLHALALSTLGNQLPVARDRDLTLVYGERPFFAPVFPDRAVTVRGSVSKLASMVQNLVSNAIKYAANEVEVRLEDGEQEVALEVRDDGRGIAPEDQARIFDEGFQAAGSLPGSGIGLHSVRRAVDLHGGSIRVSSESGGGSVFRVLLPKEPAGTGEPAG